MDEKYKRQKVLGQGSFGKAYLVENTEAKCLCVVKQMETAMMDPKERNEAVKEASMLKRMDHPNIVLFQEVFMTRKGRLCIVMDYADGGDIHMKIKKQQGVLLPEIQILEWFVQTCFALKHVHERKVLHRDLKTQNIFLMSTGQVKLGDFGIAKVLDATKDYAKTMVGTPYYLSPEIIEDRPYNFKSDIWSAGVVLYEMTTLKHPFDAETLMLLASQILKEQEPPPDPSFSSDLASLIRNMLSKDSRNWPFIHNIMELDFLQDIMHEANKKYNLGLDLPVLEPKPSPASVEQAPEAVSTGPAASAEEADTVLMGTVVQASRATADAESSPPPPPPPRPPNSDTPVPPTDEQPETREAKKANEDEDDDEYEEEFDDYSGSEEEQEQPNALKASVSRFKLDGGAHAAIGGAEPEAGSRVGAKADSLRIYLTSQVPQSEFDKAYGLVRSANETKSDAETLQKEVADIIGADKSKELFTLFQLLVFLEDYAGSGDPGTAS